MNLEEAILAAGRGDVDAAQRLCALLEKLITAEDASMISSHHPHVLRALSSPFLPLLHAILQMLQLYARTNLADPALVSAAISLLSHDSIRTASLAKDFLKTQCQHSATAVFTPTNVDQFFLLAKDDVARYRLIELLASCLDYPSAVTPICDTGLLNLIVNDLGSDDILIRMNAISSVGLISASSNGPGALLTITQGDDAKQQTIWEHLYAMASNGGNDAVTVFRTIARLGLIHVPPLFTDLILRFVADNDATLQEATCEVIASLGESWNGVRSAVQLGFLGRLTAMANQSTHSRRSPLLLALSHLLHPRDGSEDDESMLEASIMAPDFVRSLLVELEQPFPDHRMSVYALLEGLARHRWGAKAVASEPGLPQRLCNRRTEMHPQCLEWRLAIANTMCSHAGASALLTSPIHASFLVYGKEGLWGANGGEARVVVDEETN